MKTRKSIFFAVDTFHGGAGNIIQILSNHYSNYGFKIYIYLNGYHRHLDLNYRYDDENVTVIKKRFRGLRTIVNEIFFLKKTIKRLSPDLILSFLSTVNPQVCFSQIFTKIPVIVCERSNPFFDLPLRYKIIRNISYLRANLITVQFQAFENFISLFRKKIVTIPNIVQSSPSKKIHNKRTETISFITCAQLYSVKRIDLMIKLFKQINKLRPKTILKIYGVGKDQEILKNLTKSLTISDVVKFEGYSLEMHKNFSESDIFLLTSEREGFPNALCEAMSCGIPSVMFAIHDGLKEIIKDGITGFLIKEGNHDKFIEKAVELVDNQKKRKDFGINSIKHMMNYNKVDIIKIWDSYVMELLNKF